MRRVPTLDVMPVADDVTHVLANLYVLEHEIKDNMIYHLANYVIIRLVTVLERLLKILRFRSMDIRNNKTVEVDATTLRTALEMREEPTYVIKRIMAEVQGYQNINSVEDYFQKHKLPNGQMFILGDEEKKNLTKLFKLRHRLVHTVDWIIIEPDELCIFHKTVLKLTMRLIRKYTQLSESFVKASAYQNLHMDDIAKGHFKETIRLHESKLPDNLYGFLEYCVACLEVGELKRALGVFNKMIKLLSSSDSNMGTNPPAILYRMEGAILADLKCYNDAIKPLNKGLEITPNDPGLLFEMTRVQIKLGNTERALEYVLRTLSTPWTLVDSHHYLSEVYAALGNERIAQILRKYYENEKLKMAKKRFTLLPYMSEP